MFPNFRCLSKILVFSVIVNFIGHNKSIILVGVQWNGFHVVYVALIVNFLSTDFSPAYAHFNLKSDGGNYENDEYKHLDTIP